MKKLTAILVALIACALSVNAATVTNSLGQVVTVTLMSETADVGTATRDQSTYATPSAREGLLVAQCKIVAGTTNAYLAFGSPVPKGAVLLENGVIEVATALSPASATNSITLSGSDVLASGTTLGSVGIKAAVASAFITTTNSAYLHLYCPLNGATAGVFTVYLPYVLGNASR